MAESTPRPRAVRMGMLVGIPTLLLVGLPAAGWWLADLRLPQGGSAWLASPADASQVASAPWVKISGTTNRLLRPGVSARINVSFVNDSPHHITLRHVRVTIISITAPRADAGHPCTAADFRLRPMRARTFVLPGSESTDLVRLGVPAWQWPQLKMLNRPVNQDGCQNASLTLSYRGYRGW